MELKNFHTHTTYCDGKNTAEEMILAAINQGFTALGFSGHSHTSIDPSYCMTRDETRRYINELKALAERTSGVPKKPALGDRIVANLIYRDGTVIDTIKQVAD